MRFHCIYLLSILLQTIADILGSYSNEGASSATQYVENVTDVIRQKRQRRRDVTNEEMTAILKDRDIYFNKVNKEILLGGIMSFFMSYKIEKSFYKVDKISKFLNF